MSMVSRKYRRSKASRGSTRALTAIPRRPTIAALRPPKPTARPLSLTVMVPWRIPRRGLFPRRLWPCSRPYPTSIMLVLWPHRSRWTRWTVLSLVPMRASCEVTLQTARKNRSLKDRSTCSCQSSALVSDQLAFHSLKRA